MSIALCSEPLCEGIVRAYQETCGAAAALPECVLPVLVAALALPGSQLMLDGHGLTRRPATQAHLPQAQHKGPQGRRPGTVVRGQQGR